MKMSLLLGWFKRTEIPRLLIVIGRMFEFKLAAVGPVISHVVDSSAGSRSCISAWNVESSKQSGHWVFCSMGRFPRLEDAFFLGFQAIGQHFPSRFEFENWVQVRESEYGIES
jgi:hypothetical protein